MFEIADVLALAAMASKACEFKDEFIAGMLASMDAPNARWGKTRETEQVAASIEATIAVLRKLDAEHPGLLPVPHDGVSWKDR